MDLRRLIVAGLLVLAACGGGSSKPVYDDAAVRAKATDMMANRELLAPSGGPISTNDLAALLLVVHDACASKEGLRAMAQTLSANPYLMAMAFKLAHAGCPSMLVAAGVHVDPTA